MGILLCFSLEKQTCIIKWLLPQIVRAEISKHDACDKLLFPSLLRLCLYPASAYPHLLFHPLCKNIWSPHSCIRQRQRRLCFLWSNMHTHTHARGAVRRKQLKDVMGQMRIMGLQFGLDQGECLAAWRQRRVIKTACSSPPACWAAILVLSVSLPANAEAMWLYQRSLWDKQLICSSLFFPVAEINSRLGI